MDRLIFKKLGDKDPHIRANIRVPRFLGRIVAVHNAYQIADPEELCHIECANFFYHGATVPSGPGPPHYRRFMITLRHTTLGRTPLDE